MIQQTLSFVCSSVNEFLRIKYNISEDTVYLSNIVNADGSLAQQGQDRITMTLVNISEDSTMRNLQPRSSGSGDLQIRPSVKINCSVLFSSQYSGDNYATGLKMISDIISYYQSNRIFTQQNSPGLEGIERLTLDLVNLNLDELSHLWSALGVKYMPSVLFKIGYIPFQERGNRQDRVISIGKETDVK